MQAVCLLSAAQLHLQEGNRPTAAASVATAEAVITTLSEQTAAAVSQLRLHALVLTTLRQLAAGDLREVLRSGEWRQSERQQQLAGIFLMPPFGAQHITAALPFVMHDAQNNSFEVCCRVRESRNINVSNWFCSAQVV